MKKLLMFAVVASALLSASCTTMKAKSYAEKVIAAAPISNAAVVAADNEIASHLAGLSQEKVDAFWTAFHTKYAEVILPQAEAYAEKVYGGDLSFGDKARVLAEIQVHINHLSNADAATFNEVYGARRDAIIKERTSGLFNGIKDAVNNAVDSVIDAVSNIGKNDVEQAVDSAIDAVSNIGKEDVEQAVGSAIDAVSNIGKESVDQAVDSAIDAVSNISKEDVDQAVEKAKQSIENVLQVFQN